MERRVEGPRADAVTVPRQLLGDFRAVNRLFGRVVEKVQANEAVEEMPGDGIVSHVLFIPVSDSDIVRDEVPHGKAFLRPAISRSQAKGRGGRRGPSKEAASAGRKTCG